MHRIFKRFLPIAAMLIVTLSTACLAQKPLRFQNLSINDGLSQSLVFCITQDFHGYMWFGTEDGLNRYDGYEFAVFRNESTDTNSLSNNGILSILEDSKGRLWIGTNGDGLNMLNRKTGTITRFKDQVKGFVGGYIYSIYEDGEGILWLGSYGILSRYDPSTGEASYYKHVPNDSNSAPGGKIRAIVEDKKGNLWLGSRRGSGLSKFNRETGKFMNYTHRDNNPEGLSSNNVITLFIDSKEYLWIGTYGAGLDRVDLANLDNHTQRIKFDHFRHDPENPHSLSKDRIAAIYEDSKGQLWIGTHGGGLNMLDRNSGVFHRYVHDPLIESSLSSNTVYTIFEDDFGGLWFGTRAGINKYDPLADKFLVFNQNAYDSSSLSNNQLRGIATGDDGMAWIGTQGGGLNRLDLDNGQIQHYTHDPKDPGSLNNNSIRSLLKDKNGKIWIGSVGTDLCCYDPDTETFTTFTQYGLACKRCLGGNRVNVLFEDFDGNLWMGTDGGLARWDLNSDSLIHYRRIIGDESTVSSPAITFIYQTRDSVIWIGTSKSGFNKFNATDNTFKRYQHDPMNPASSPFDKIRCITQGKDGAMWIGTLGGGLVRFDPDSETFKNWRMPIQSDLSPDSEVGLPNDMVYGILEDDHGNLWMSTNTGIAKFNPRNESFRNFDVSDGLQSNEFSSGAFHKSANGLMFFGGIEGLNVFHPDSIVDNPIPPQMAIGKFSIFNQEVIPGNNPESRLTKPINYTDTLFLSYKDNVFSFEFAALHYGISEKNQYAYQMEGFEKEWNYVGRRRFATYTNLDPGAYTFRVKGSNSDGVWNEAGKSVYIIIAPPFWQTWWFKVLTVMAVVAGIVIYIKRREASLRRQRALLREKVNLKTKQLRKQKDEIEEKNKDITDSIQYASTIQQAILPKEEEMKKVLPDHFVFYAPRDIVSGDFYWFAEKGKKIFIAVCDCTGHGVPGAFLSMIGNDLLNKFIMEHDLKDPGEILSQLSNGIQAVFTRKGSVLQTSDGMDMALAVFDRQLNTMECAGAHNSIFIFRNSNGEEVPTQDDSDDYFTTFDQDGRYRFREIRGDRYPIGGRTELDFKFTRHTVNLKKGDAIYLFSDGIIDQFGGKREKKFTKKRLVNTLFKVQDAAMPEQKIALEEKFIAWKADFEQIDDVLVLGIKA
ncbi:MAG: SpoIIE family protein phosphatase [Flavobacteriales bacterium]|nr:SpoIIE family protein phosphatase [Flavobacteriales bacterium]